MSKYIKYTCAGVVVNSFTVMNNYLVFFSWEISLSRISLVFFASLSLSFSIDSRSRSIDSRSRSIDSRSSCRSLSIDTHSLSIPTNLGVKSKLSLNKYDQ